MKSLSLEGLTERDKARFWAKVDKSGDCWVWIAGRYWNGYGQFGVEVAPGQRLPFKAHRISYTLLVGPIPDGLTIDHLCGNKLCVNPDHLEAVTHVENIRRYQEMVGHEWFGHDQCDHAKTKAARKACRRSQQGR